MRDKEIRLLEAMSGVDAELLERCEQSGQDVAENESVKAEKRSGLKMIKMPVWKIGSAVAAVLCLVMVGAGLMGNWGVEVRDECAENVTYTAHTTSDYVGVLGAAEDKMAPASGENVNDSLASADDVVNIKEATEELYTKDEPLKKEAENEENKSIWHWLNQIMGAKQESAQESGGMGATEGIVAESALMDKEKAGAEEQKLTETELAKVEVLGQYVPVQMPEGYAFESAYLAGEKEKCLVVCYNRGMDSIMLCISKPANVPETVEVARTELYDEYLYEIPHAETVPEAYRDVFENPICARADLGLEFVKKRMISREGDKGDSATPRGSFGVLYPDGVLVEFNGRGTAEEIWEMFCGLGGNESR